MKAIVLLAATLSLPLAAQHENHGERHGEGQGPGQAMRHEGMGMPLMREVHVWRPQNLLERREVLGLTADQVTRLERLAAEAREAHDRAHQAAQDHLRQAAEAWSGGNGDGATSHAAAGMASMQQAHLAMLGAAGAARNVLTAEQRARVQGWLDMRGASRTRQPMRRMRPMRPGRL